MMNMAPSGVFLDPPRDAVAQHVWAPVYLTATLVVISAIVGVVYTRRTRSPLYFWSAVSGFTLFPLLVEPFGDWFIAVWYPLNHPHAATVFDRPMPWLAVLFYGAGIPLVTVAAYEIVKRGLPARRLLLLIVIVTIAELPMEMLGSQQQWMIYYGNHATLLGVPIYCIIQNGGMFAVVAWVLGWLIPRVHGWRWIIVPFALAATLPAFALLTTWPAYIAIHTHAGPAVGWAAGIVATGLNAAVVIWCVYSPTLDSYRNRTIDGSRQGDYPGATKITTA